MPILRVNMCQGKKKWCFGVVKKIQVHNASVISYLKPFIFHKTPQLYAKISLVYCTHPYCLQIPKVHEIWCVCEPNMYFWINASALAFLSCVTQKHQILCYIPNLQCKNTIYGANSSNFTEVTFQSLEDYLQTMG